MLSFTRFSPIHTSLLAIAVFAGAVAVSAPREAAAEGGPPPLPEVAFTSCQSKAEGDACTVQFHEREAKGSCAKHSTDARLFCRLNDPPPPPPNGDKPPQ